MTKDWFTAAELAGLPGVQGTERGINKGAEREKWERRKKLKGKGWEYHITSLPVETQAHLLIQQKPTVTKKDTSTEAPAYESKDLWALYDAKPEKQKDIAHQRMAAVRAALLLIENGIGRTHAFEQAAKQAGFNRASLYRWYQECKKYGEGDWLPVLAPHYVGRKKTADCSADAWESFKADYLRNEKPGYTACYERLKRTATDYDWTVPSLATLKRRMEREVPHTIRILKREGEQALLRLYPAQQRTVADLHALQWVNADGYQHNVFVQWPDGTIARPKTWVWQDIYSRKILAHRTDQTEHTDVIRLSFGDLVERYGIPEHATIDNTRAAANKWMTGGVPNRYRFKVKEDDPLGILTLLGIQVHWTSVYKGKGHGQAKPIERAFGVGGVGEYIDKHPAFAGAFTGHNPTAKPENYGSKAIPLSDFLAVLEQEIHAWNAREGRQTEIARNVKSFDQVFEDSYSESTIRKATPEQRRLWLLAAEAIRVRKDATVILEAGSSVGIGKNRYYAESLYEHVDKKVVLRFDPDHLHSPVHVYTLDGRYISEATCIQDTGFGDTHAAREHNRARKQFIRATKDMAKAEEKMDAIEVAERLPGVDVPTLPNAGAVRMMQPSCYQTRTPQPRELSAEEQAVQQALEEELKSPVRSITEFETPQDRYARWARIEQQIENDQVISMEIRKQLDNYKLGDEYRSMKEFFKDFGLSIGEAN